MAKAKITRMTQFEDSNEITVFYASGARRIVTLGPNYYGFTKTQKEFLLKAGEEAHEIRTILKTIRYTVFTLLDE